VKWLATYPERCVGCESCMLTCFEDLVQRGEQGAVKDQSIGKRTRLWN